MLGPREAARRIVDALVPLPVESRALMEADGAVVAATLHAPIAMPRWRNSAMDGFACHAADVATATAAAPVRLPIVGSVRAGDDVPPALARGAAMRVATGAPVPDGCDSVIRVEDTTTASDTVSIADARDAGRNVRRAGEDVHQGAVVARAGDRLHPGRIGFLASVGIREVSVHRAVRVAIIATGDELVTLEDFDAAARPPRIVSSNSVSLVAAVRALGAIPIDHGIIRDDAEALTRALEAAAASADLVLTTAGVSVGEYDHVKQCVQGLGGRVDLWRVRMRPGSPLAAGHIAGTPWIGLPGNPVSTLVTFTLFAAPAIRRLAGATAVYPRPVPVRTHDTVQPAPTLTQFLRVAIDSDDDGTLRARSSGVQASNIVSSLAGADAVLIVPPGDAPIPGGSLLQAIPLGSDPLLSSTP